MGTSNSENFNWLRVSTCDEIIWETQTAKLQGFDVDISDIGSWSLNIHHHYNFNEAKDSKLLTPVALASGPDGSLYVGDFNLVRRIMTDEMSSQ
ncbi:hypothetical protein PVAND_011941 [Polypedilum vanderplanki]|uniref:Teneurin NHL domain-containing protein n=1 Tax=Polypedilum vanderplanki TaxID=319348 RepID=A0A9J6CLW7_POLVA|nr:hypothetical protein PVAND_011941 [Polypedilum vanderplanki]